MSTKAPQSIQFEMKIPITIKKKGKWYISSCPALDVVTQGETLERARENIIDALSCFLIGCIEHGTLETVLKDCGFTRAVPPEELASPQDAHADYVTVPVHLVAGMEGGSRCHA